jgi:membrane fusion protein, copper/silver efflux system
MNPKRWIFGLLVVVVLGASGLALYRLGLTHAARTNALRADVATPSSSGASPMTQNLDAANGKKVLYWHDPMVPGQKFDKPGKSPFMDMQLVPVYAEGDGADTGGVAISPRVQQNLGVRTAEVTRGALGSTAEAVGSVAYNERDVAVVQARSNGFLEKLYVRAPLDPVRKGQPLAELYVPDWVSAQEEYLSAKRIDERSRAANGAGLADAAKQRMRLAGMSDPQISAVETGGQVQPRFIINAPIGGVVGELSAREGMTVMAGASLFRINGLSTVWINADVPEAAAAQIRPGSLVEVRASAISGTVVKGKVSAILPEVNPATRTLKARIEVANPNGQLLPGMFTTVTFLPTAGKDVLLVPSEAVIQTGRRSVVVLAQPDGTFVPTDVDLGLESSGRTEIRKGLQLGQKVVVSGQFLVDSEASLKATTTRMGDMQAMTAGPLSPALHHGEGKVEAISKEEVTISHGPIASLQWGPMTMGFKLPTSGLPPGIAIGAMVVFDIRQNKDGAFAITSIAPAQLRSPPRGDAAAKGAINGPQTDTRSGAKP